MTRTDAQQNRDRARKIISDRLTIFMGNLEKADAQADVSDLTDGFATALKVTADNYRGK